MTWSPVLLPHIWRSAFLFVEQLVGLTTVTVLQQTMDLSPRQAPVILLVAGIVSCVPTSSECMVMAEIGKFAAQGNIASAICAQYALSPVLLTGFCTLLAYASAEGT